jgi:hypothetical protein
VVFYQIQTQILGEPPKFHFWSGFLTRPKSHVILRL